MDSREYRNLQEAYLGVYSVDEAAVDWEMTDDEMERARNKRKFGSQSFNQAGQTRSRRELHKSQRGMTKKDVRRFEGVKEEFDELDEVWGRGKVDPNYGTHNRDNERTGQQAGGRAMTRTPADKTRDKLAKLKGLADLRKPLGSQHTPVIQRRIRKLTTATRENGAELAGQHVQRIDMRTRERERADQLAADARERGRAEGRKESQNESYDLYDIILSHLLDEGYADTLEAAEGIMVSMSEEWREEIIDEANTVMSVSSPSGKTRALNHAKAKPSRNLQYKERLDAFRDIEQQRVNRRAPEIEKRIKGRHGIRINP